MQNTIFTIQDYELAMKVSWTVRQKDRDAVRESLDVLNQVMDLVMENKPQTELNRDLTRGDFNAALEKIETVIASRNQNAGKLLAQTMKMMQKLAQKNQAICLHRLDRKMLADMKEYCASNSITADEFMNQCVKDKLEKENVQGN